MHTKLPVTKVYPVKVYQNAKLFMSYHVLWYVHMYVLWYFQSSMLFSKKISTCLLFLLISKPRIAPAIPIPPPARPWLSSPKVRPAVRSRQGRQAGTRGEEPMHWGPIALRMWTTGYLMVPVLKTDSDAGFHPQRISSPLIGGWCSIWKWQLGYLDDLNQNESWLPKHVDVKWYEMQLIRAPETWAKLRWVWTLNSDENR